MNSSWPKSLSALTDRVQRGEGVDLDQACREHPELAAELRELWGTVIVANAVGSAASTDLAADELLDVEESPILPRRVGDYELLRELGRGGMGVVYLARQVNLNRELAVKMILRGPLASAGRSRPVSGRGTGRRPAGSSGHRAGLSGGRGQRPAVLQHEVHSGTDPVGTAWSKDRSPPRQTARLLAKVCRAIEFAHRQGVLHRDLKPSNILIDEQGEPHVTDFGLAKQIGRSTERDPAGRHRRHARLHVSRTSGGQPRQRRAAPATSTAWAPSSTTCSPVCRRFSPARPSIR